MDTLMPSLKAVPHLSHLIGKPIDKYPYCTEGAM